MIDIHNITKEELMLIKLKGSVDLGYIPSSRRKEVFNLLGEKNIILSKVGKYSYKVHIDFELNTFGFIQKQYVSAGRVIKPNLLDSYELR